jgi:glycosyltransferase involved in cell wall biosynthesis
LRKKIVVRAPVLTRSGYGEHSRFLLRSLRERGDVLDIHIIPVGWGKCGWITQDDEERAWLDRKIGKTAAYMHNGGKFDVSIQVTIPNEWEKLAPINIGVTAGIETTKCSPVWLERANMMDKIITISAHSKRVFTDTIYHGQNTQTNEPMTLKCEVPVEIAHYPVKVFESLPELSLNLDYDHNYLVVAQDGPRKNLENTIRWFIEENFDQEVGLVVKSFHRNCSISDRIYTEKQLSLLLSKYPDRKCKVYLLHGDMSDEEMHALYKHPQIKCLVTLAHGEGFGLPIFEAAYSGVPIIAPGWSGQCDFLYAPFQGSKKKKKKEGKHPYFAEVDYNISPVQKSARWEGVIEKDSMWCFPQEGSYKMKLRQVRKNYSKWEKKANTLQAWILENFEENKMKENFVNHIISDLNLSSDDDIDAMFSDIMANVGQ